MRFLQSNWFVFILIGLGLIFPFTLKYLNIEFIKGAKIDLEKASLVGGYLAGTTGLLWGLASIILVYKAFIGGQQQQAENTFFLMLNTLNDIINNTKGEIVYNNYEGSQFFSEFLNLFKHETQNLALQDEYRIEKNNPPHRSHPETGYSIYEPEFIKWTYNKTYSKYQAQLGHFFRYSYNIIKYVNNNGILTRENKKQLINLIQAQVSNDILGIIFYNCQTEQGTGFKELLDKDYKDFFGNIDQNSMVQNQNGKIFNSFKGYQFKHIERIAIPEKTEVPA